MGLGEPPLRGRDHRRFETQHVRGMGSYFPDNCIGVDLSKKLAIGDGRRDAIDEVS